MASDSTHRERTGTPFGEVPVLTSVRHGSADRNSFTIVLGYSLVSEDRDVVESARKWALDRILYREAEVLR